MKIISGKQGTGKTEKLLKLAQQTGAAVLCQNKRAMREKANAKGYQSIQCVEIRDLKDLKRGAPIVIDDALALFKNYLESAFSVEVQGMDFTQ